MTSPGSPHFDPAPNGSTRTRSAAAWRTLTLVGPSGLIAAVVVFALFEARRGQPVGFSSLLLLALAAAAILLCLLNTRMLLRSSRAAETTTKEVSARNLILRKQDAYLRTLIDTVPDIIFAQDADGRIQMANQTTAAVLGVPVHELIGQMHSGLTPHSADVAELAQQIRRVLTSGEANVVERPAAHPVTGELRWFETRVVPLFPPAGGPAHALVVAIDLTDRKRAEEKLRLSQQEVLNRLAEAAEFRDNDTGQHTRRVGRLAARIARLVGLSEAEAELIEQAAPLHDIGKIGVPDAILLKPTGLTEREFDIMKTHTEIGAKLLSGGASDLMRMAEEIAFTHHERWDGSGYPQGLRGDENSPIARIVWVADIVDALAHDRPYRPAWSIDRITEEIQRQRGRKLEPDCADACLEIITARDFDESFANSASW